MNSSTLHHHSTTLTLHLPSSKRHRFTPSSSFQPFRRHLRRNLLKKPLPTTTPPPLSSPEPSSSLQLQIPLHPPNYLHQFTLASQDAIHDLKTLITFDNPNNPNYPSYYTGVSPTRRVVVSCKRSTVEFLGFVLVSSIVIVYAVRVVLGIGRALWSWEGERGGEGKVVYKADRSLGGKLVAVGSNDRAGVDYGASKGNEESFLDWGGEVKEWRGKRAKFPKWWPKVESVGFGIGGMMGEEEKEEYQKLANRFIRGC